MLSCLPRIFINTLVDSGGYAVNNKPQAGSDRDEYLEKLTVLLKRAEQGDKTALPELREALDADSRLWERYGHLGEHASATLIELAAGKNLLMAESLLRKIESMKEELAGESPSPLEKLLVERIVATWLQITYFDAHLARIRDCGDARLKMLEAQRDGAHRRHLAAVRSLATVRKLLTPSPSPLDIATRLERGGAAVRRGGVGVVGKVPVAAN
jgi:hypothetical protein